MGTDIFDHSEYDEASSIQRQQANQLFAMLETALTDRQPPMRLLDIGCGDGKVTRALARAYPNATVIGIDSSAQQINRAQSHTSAENPVQYIHTDVTEFSPAEPFDVVFSNAAMHWVQNQRTAYSTIAEFLTPGGVLAIHQGHANCYKELREAAETAAAETGVAEVLDGFEYPLVYHTQESLRRLFDSVPLTLQTVKVVESESAETLPEDFAEAGLLPYRERVPDAVEDEFVTSYLAAAPAVEDVDKSRLYFVATR